MVSSESSELTWPAWPNGAKSQRILEMQVNCAPEELFLLLWAPKSPYVVRPSDVLDLRYGSTHKGATISALLYSRIHRRTHIVALLTFTNRKQAACPK